MQPKTPEVAFIDRLIVSVGIPACPVETVFSGDTQIVTGGETRAELPPREGELCPQCHTTTPDYDGLLNLTCPRCGFTLNGSFT